MRKVVIAIIMLYLISLSSMPAARANLPNICNECGFNCTCLKCTCDFIISPRCSICGNTLNQCVCRISLICTICGLDINNCQCLTIPRICQICGQNIRNCRCFVIPGICAECGYEICICDNEQKDEIIDLTEIINKLDIVIMAIGIMAGAVIGVSFVNQWKPGV